MNLRELRDEQGRLFGIVVPTEDIVELQNSLKTDSQLFRNLSALLIAEEPQVTTGNQKMPNGYTIAETHAKTIGTTENLYKSAFSKGVAMYYQDERAKSPKEFVRANPDGSEDLVSFDLPTRSYSLIEKLVPAGEGRWAFLL